MSEEPTAAEAFVIWADLKEIETKIRVQALRAYQLWYKLDKKEKAVEIRISSEQRT